MEKDRETGADEEQERMGSREGGNVILQFILEEQLLPPLSDGNQLPQDGETKGRKREETKTNWRWISKAETQQQPTAKV